MDTLPSEDTWQAWMVQFGAGLRHLREGLALSQEEVARSAGVSQAAISRLEGGRGLATPLPLVLKTLRVLASALSTIDPPLLSASSVRWLDAQRGIEAFGNVLAALPTTILGDDDSEHLLRLYRSLPRLERGVAVAILESLAAGAAPHRAAEAGTFTGEEHPTADPARTVSPPHAA